MNINDIILILSMQNASEVYYSNSLMKEPAFVIKKNSHNFLKAVNLSYFISYQLRNNLSPFLEAWEFES